MFLHINILYQYYIIIALKYDKADNKKDNASDTILETHYSSSRIHVAWNLIVDLDSQGQSTPKTKKNLLK